MKRSKQIAEKEQKLAHSKPETQSEVESAMTDAELKRLADAYKWALLHKTKREIIGLCLELHIKYEYMKHELERTQKEQK